MTNTTILNAVNLGTTTELKVSSPTKTTLQTGTTGVILNVKIVGSTWNSNQNDKVRVGYAVSPFTITADAQLATHLAPICGYLEVPTPRGNSQEIYVTSGIIANNGGNLYTWFDSPALAQDSSAAPTITLTSVELP